MSRAEKITLSSEWKTIFEIAINQEKHRVYPLDDHSKLIEILEELSELGYFKREGILCYKLTRAGYGFFMPFNDKIISQMTPLAMKMLRIAYSRKGFHINRDMPEVYRSRFKDVDFLLKECCLVQYEDGKLFISERGINLYHQLIDQIPPEPIVHDVKSWTGLFQPIHDGVKTHDIRVLDRDYRVKDFLLLREWHPTERVYTGRWAYAAITYITSAQHTPCAFSPIALHEASGVLSIKLLFKGTGDVPNEMFEFYRKCDE